MTYCSINAEAELQNSIKNLKSVEDIFDTVWDELRPNHSDDRWGSLTEPMRIILLERLSHIQGAFVNWTYAYDRLSFKNYPNLKIFVLKKMFNTAKTSTDWRFLFIKSGSIQDKQCEILEKLFCSANELDNLFFVRKNIGEDLVLKDRVEQKILDFCTTFKLCVQALKKCDNKQSDFAKNIMEKSDELEVSFEELCHIKRYNSRDLLIKTLIISKFPKVSTSLENWISLLKNTAEDNPLRSIILTKVKDCL